MNITLFALSYLSGVPEPPIDGYPFGLLVLTGVVCFLTGYVMGRRPAKAETLE